MKMGEIAVIQKKVNSTPRNVSAIIFILLTLSLKC